MIAFERTLLTALSRSRAAMAAGNFTGAAALMREARELSERALRDRRLLSRPGLVRVALAYRACAAAQPR